MSRQRQDMPPSSLLLTEAVISRLAREFPSCESCPRREHLRLILLAEISKVDKRVRCTRELTSTVEGRGNKPWHTEQKPNAYWRSACC